MAGKKLSGDRLLVKRRRGPGSLPVRGVSHASLRAASWPGSAGVGQGKLSVPALQVARCPRWRSRPRCMSLLRVRTRQSPFCFSCIVCGVCQCVRLRVGFR